MFAGDSVSRLAVAVHNFLTEEAVALHGIAVPLAAGHGIDTKTNHADFGA